MNTNSSLKNLAARSNSWKKIAVERLHSSAEAPVSDSFLLISAAVSIILTFWLLRNCHYGLDFSDECYYLFKITQPWLNRKETTLFGYVYHQLYLLVGADVVLLRQVGLLIQLILAWVLCWNFLAFLRCDDECSRNPHRIFIVRAIISFSLATGGLLTAFSMTTPSYNDLNKTAYLLAGIGILSAGSSYSLRSIFGWLLIGVSGYLAFLAKPPSSVALGILILLYMIITRKFNLKLQVFAIVVCLSLLAITEISFHGSISAAVDNTRQNLFDSQALGHFYTLGNVFRFNSPARLFRPKLHGIASNAFLILLTITFLWSVKNSRRHSLLTGVVFTSTIIVILDSLYSGRIAGLLKYTWNTEDALAVIVWQALFFVVVCMLFLYGRKLFSAMSREHLAFFCCALAFPYAFAFGSGVNQLFLTAFLAIFVIFALLLLIHANVSRGAFFRILIPATAVVQLLLATNTAIHAEFPQRQSTPYRNMHRAIELPRSPTPIKVGDDFIDYITKLRSLAYENGFEKGTPVINLTGYDVGSVYLLEGYPTGAIWLFSSDREGGTKFAEIMLEREPSERKIKSWILTAPDSKASIHTSVLEKIQLSWENYELVADLVAPQSIVSGTRQYFYKPKKIAKEKLEAILVVEQQDKRHDK